ncbi:MAG: multiubiquitin domain-containing protein [Gammaproteobacteria bacterium]|nr:multiubiquitin domain-containing protein [Gammaproteobacteria bacterium]
MTDDNVEGPRPISISDRGYKVQIDKEFFVVLDPVVTGHELLQLAGKVPVERYALYLKVKGDQPVRVKPDERIDLSRQEVERFVTLPLDQTEGLIGRRDFSLPQEDLLWLDHGRYRFELIRQENVLRVVLYDFPVPKGYQQLHVEVNVRIESGYPDSQIDMVYVHPALRRLDNTPISAISSEEFDGKQWQRWSRHRTSENPWRPGVDNLATHFALVEDWFARELQKA